MRAYILPVAFIIMIGSGCQSAPAETPVAKSVVAASPVAVAPPTSTNPGKPANAATIMARKQVPILCYHQIRDWRPTDSKVSKDYIVPVDIFKAQMKMLADSG